MRCVLVALLVSLPIVTSAGSLANAGTNGWAISGGVAFDVGDYGQDGDGATFIAAGITTPHRQSLSVRAHVEHGSYSGYDGVVGPVKITPIGVGARYYALQGSLQPYVELLPSITFAKWGSYGDVKGLASIQGSLGLSAVLSARAGLDVDIGYLKTEGSVVEASDSPDMELKGLEQVLARAFVCFYFGGSRR